MQNNNTNAYKQFIKDQLKKFESLLNEYFSGNFSEKLSVPQEENDLKMLFQQMNYLGDYLQGLIKEKDHYFNEWKLTEKKRQKNKELLDRTQRIANVGSWELDLAQNKLTWSDEVFRIFGLEPQEFEATYEAFLNTVHPEDRKAVSDAYENSIRDGRQHYEIDHRIIRQKTGEVRYVHEKCEHIRNEAGEIVRSIGMVQDITERKQAEFDLQKKNEELETTEEELRASNEELQQINQMLEEQKRELEIYKKMVEGSEDMMAAVDKNYNFIYANNAYSKYYQFNSHEIIGHNLRTIVGEKSFKEKVKPNVDKCLRGETINYEMYRHVPEFGNVWLDITYYPLKQDGAIQGAIAVMRNITDRKQAKDELLIKNHISNTFINSKSENFYKEVLDVFRDVFSSEYGFFGYINDEGDLVSESLTMDVWAECQIEDKSIVFPKDSWAGVWGDSLKQKKTLYKNENLQLPEGHVQLTSAMAAPIMLDDQLIGQIALANKPQGYDNNDKKQINRLCDYIAPLLHSILQEEQYKKELVEAKNRAEESEALLQAAMENSQAGIAITEVPSGKLRFGDEKALSILKGDYEELEENENIDNKNANWQVLHLDGTQCKKGEHPLTRASLHGETCSKEFLIRQEDNKDHYVLSNASPVKNTRGEQTAAIAVFLDITDRKLAEKRVEHINNILRAIRNVNQLIVKEKDPNKLISETCNQLTATRGYLSVWIALYDEDQNLSSLASQNMGEHFHSLKKWLNDGNICDCHNIASNKQGAVFIEYPSQTCINCPMSSEYKENSALVCRLEHNGITYGFINATIPGNMRWHGEESQLFEELAGDIAYAIYSIEMNEKRKKAEEKIRKNEAELASIYENAPFIMMLMDRERRVRKINRYGERFVNASSEKLIGLKGGAALQCVHHFDDPRGCGFGSFCQNCPISNTILDTFKNDKPHENIEGTLPFYRNGEKKNLTLLISTSPIDIQEEPLILVSILDITDRKNAEKNLAEREEKYRQIFNNTNDAMYLHKYFEGGNPGNFTEVNDVACNMLGYNRQEFLNMSPSDIDDPNFTDNSPYILQELEKKNQVIFETNHVAKNREFIPVEVSSQMFTMNNESYVLSAVRDITERKQAEENIYRSLEKEKELNQMKTRFLSMVSHEFRTPLANISTNTQMLQRYNDRLDTSEKHKYHQKILDSVGLLNSMLSDISFYHKKQDGKVKPKPSKIDIKPFIQSIINEIQSHHNWKNEIVFDLQCEYPEIVIDKFLLRYVITNLLSNAVKYSETDVMLQVECGEDTNLLIRVKDRGMGIPKKDLDNIFEPFFRSENSGTKRGTGLGMAIAKHCIDLLGGNINITSEVNRGTTAIVWVPYQISNK